MAEHKALVASDGTSYGAVCAHPKCRWTTRVTYPANASRALKAEAEKMARERGAAHVRESN